MNGQYLRNVLNELKAAKKVADKQVEEALEKLNQTTQADGVDPCQTEKDLVEATCAALEIDQALKAIAELLLEICEQNQGP